MIKQFSVDIKTDDSLSECDLEMAINQVLILAGFKVKSVDWRSTWDTEEHYEKGFGPDSSD